MFSSSYCECIHTGPVSKLMQPKQVKKYGTAHSVFQRKGLKATNPLTHYGVPQRLAVFLSDWQCSSVTDGVLR